MTTHLTEFHSGSQGAPLTMSSREIAELTNVRHDNVMRVCRSLRDEKVCPQIEETPYVSPQNGQTYREFLLKKRDSLVLVARLSPEFTARIVDRWMELEEAVAKPVALDYSDPKVVLGVLEHLSGKVAEQQQVIEHQGERLKKLDRLEGAHGSMCITDAAKTLKIGRDDLKRFMQSRGWIYKRAGNKNWLAFQAKIQTGCMEHEDYNYIDSEGRERVSTRALVTAKGLVKLAELLGEPTH